MKMMHFLDALKRRLKSTPKTKERRRFQPRLELLEDRLAPAIFIVNTTVDENNGIGLGAGTSLREAILAANQFPNIDTINFSIGTGLQTINLISALPQLTGPVTIDGTSQPGFSNVTFKPLIELNGTGTSGASGLIMNATLPAYAQTVKSLIINNFDAAGVVAVKPNARVEGCYIGTDSAGTAAAANGFYGVVLAGNANGVRIGGALPIQRNVISGNSVGGVYITGPLAQNIKVLGNYIGTDFNGTANLGNNGNGVFVDGGAKFNAIGGALTAERNVISGNVTNGVNISDVGTTFNLVQGNYIGTDVNGTADLGNSEAGVLIDNGASNNTVGARNVISGNNTNGVEIADVGTTSNRVIGNYIGTDFNGTADLGNERSGVLIFNGAANNLVGGIVASARNIISGNDSQGVQISDLGTNLNRVQGNYIGTNVAGTLPLPNSADGVYISAGAGSNVVGGAVAGARNLISGNSNDGVGISGSPGPVGGPNIPTAGNTVQGNYIGTNFNGTSVVGLGNTYDGVRLESGATSSKVGGIALLARNVISGNGANGVEITSLGTTFNVLQNNYIGTNALGTIDLGNLSDGVRIANAAINNTVGGIAVGVRNLISGNNKSGVEIFDADFNKVQGNYIGTNFLGTLPIGNTIDGVQLDSSADNNTIGGTVIGARNLISGNAVDGVRIQDGGTLNVVQGNYIGTTFTGNASLGNTFDGIEISAGSFNNTIGGIVAGARNVISGNGSRGVVIGGTAAGTSFNKVQGNYIGVNALGTADLGNGDAGVTIATFTGIPSGTAANNIIGGLIPAARNIISGNDKSGVVLTGPQTTTNVVQGNYIGLAANGTSPVANTLHGVFINDQAANNSIGGIVAGAGNRIANNTGVGVLIGGDPSLGANVPAGSGNSVLSNSIFSNGLGGIDLGPKDGPTANDLGDPDTGPNDLLNKPVFLNLAWLNGPYLFFILTINTLPSSALRIEFFANPTGGTQGQTFVGFQNVLTDASGNFLFGQTVTLPPGSHSLTATATDSMGNTSEFSIPLTF